ncbi:MAG: O-antigen ligase family protein [Deltaproteobacteria bacterium]|nr:O-antigen ligase family protein [Deltaproteobacteria bacterium]
MSIYMLYNPDIWWGATLVHYLPRPSFVAMLFLTVGTFIHRDKLNWTFSRREIELYLFLGTVWFVSLFFGIGIEDNNWTYLIKITKLFIFIFFFIRVVDSLNHYKLVIWTFILGAALLAYHAQGLSSGYFADGRLEAIGGIDFSESNGFACFQAMAMTFLGVQLLRDPLWKKLIYVLGIALMLDTIILTQSRAIFLGIMMAVPYVLFQSPPKYRRQVYVSVILGGILFFMLADVKFLGRMDTIQFENPQEEIISREYQGETIDRIDFWKASISMFMDHPFGVGVKNFEKMVPYYDPRNPGKDAHNTYVLCYSEIGILGITLFLIIIGETFLQLRRIRLAVKNTQHENDITLHTLVITTVLIIYLLGYMMTHSNLYTEMLWILLAMPICLENATQKLLEEGKNRGFEDEKVGSEKDGRMGSLEDRDVGR